jgi:hypothetical protein
MSYALHLDICCSTFLESTTYERKTGFLLIELFKLFNTQNYGHQGTILGGLFYNAGLMRRKWPSC